MVAMVAMDNSSRVDDLVAPLAIDFSCFCRPDDSYLVEDGDNANSENVSTQVASKLKSIVAYIKLAFSGYEHEVIHVLSRIENSNVTPSQVCHYQEAKGALET